VISSNGAQGQQQGTSQNVDLDSSCSKANQQVSLPLDLSQSRVVAKESLKVDFCLFILLNDSKAPFDYQNQFSSKSFAALKNVTIVKKLFPALR
jgi:hypothetical protein